MKQNANNFKFRVLPLKLDPNWDQIGTPSMYVKKVGLLLKHPLPVKALKLGILLPVTEGEVLLWVLLAKREEKHLCQSIFQLQVVMYLPKVCTNYKKHVFSFPCRWDYLKTRDFTKTLGTIYSLYGLYIVPRVRILLVDPVQSVYFTIFLQFCLLSLCWTAPSVWLVLLCR